MKMMGDKQKAILRYPLKICFIGEEWTGKSSAGNTMLGQTVFKVDSDTEHVLHGCGVIEGRNVIIVDMPGWDSECSPYVPLKMLKNGLTSTSLTCQGFHVLLLTIPISQNQEWNQKFATRLLNTLRLFTDDIWKHTMLLFTRSDLLHSTGFEGYLKGSGWPLQSLVEKCEHRCHVLNNHQQNNRKQVSELLEKIEQMVQENKGQSLQVKSEQEVGTLREHDMEDNRQLVEVYSKTEEHPGSESCFKLDYVFKSLRPEENDSPNPTEQSELPEENSTCAWPPKNEMSHPVEMQDAACEYIHIQDQDTKSTHHLCSENSADINKDLAISSDEDSDTEMSGVDQTEQNTWTEVKETGMDRFPRALEKKKKQFILPITPQTWDISCSVNLTCHVYSEVSDQQYVPMACVLQVSDCWRKMKPSCARDWISFTVCADDIIWLFIIILYLFGKTLCLIKKSYEVSKKAGNQTINAKGFVELQQELSKDNLQCSAVGHDEDEELFQQSQKGEEEQVKIPQQSKKGEDEELCQHIHKGEEEYELPQHSQEGKQEQEIPQQCKKGEDNGPTQHIHICEEEYELPQHSQNKEEEEEKEEDEIPQHSQNEEEKEKEDEIPQHSQNEDDEEEEEPKQEQELQQKTGADEEIPHLSKSGDKAIPQHDCNEDDKNILQQRKRVDDVQTLQYIIKEDEKQITNKLNGMYDNMSQNDNRQEGGKKVDQRTKLVDYEKIPQNSKKADKKEIQQYNCLENDKEIPQCNCLGDDKEIPQCNCLGHDKEISPCKWLGDDEELPPCKWLGDDKELPPCKWLGGDKEISPCKWLGDDEETPQNNRDRNNEEMSKHNRRTYNEDVLQQKRNRNDGDIYQQRKSAPDNVRIPRHNRSGLDDEILQHMWNGNEKQVTQHTSVEDTGEIKDAPEQQVGGTVRHSCCRNQETDGGNNFAVVRKAEKTVDVRREKFRGTRKTTRSQSMDILVKLRYSAEEDPSQQRRCRKFRRTRSLERNIVFNS